MRVFGELSYYILIITCLTLFVNKQVQASGEDTTDGEEANQDHNDVASHTDKTKVKAHAESPTAESKDDDHADEENSASEDSNEGANLTSQSSQTAADGKESEKIIKTEEKATQTTKVQTDIERCTTKGEAKLFFDALLTPRRPKVRVIDFDQRLDQFNILDTRMWTQRAYLLDEHEKYGGPVLLKVGGLHEIGPETVEDKGLLRLAKRLRAPLYFLEHRYFGRSVPTNVSTENLEKYCTTEQALLDIEHFIIRSERSMMKWIVFGDLSGGTLAALFRLKFPHVVAAAVVYNAPVVAIPEYNDTFRIFQEKYVSENSANTIKEAFKEIHTYKQENKFDELKEKFKMCTRLDKGNNVEDNMNFMLWSILTYIKEGMKFYSAQIMSGLTNTLQPKALDRLAFVMRDILEVVNDKCFPVNYGEAINKYKNANIKYDNGNEIDYPKALKLGLGIRPYHFLRCMECGMFETSDGTYTYDFKIPLNFYLRICRESFNEKFDLKLFKSALDTTNMMYGGKDFGGTNLIYLTRINESWKTEMGLTESKSDEIIVIDFDGNNTGNMKHEYDLIVDHLKKWTKVEYRLVNNSELDAKRDAAKDKVTPAAEKKESTANEKGDQGQNKNDAEDLK